MLVRSRTRTRGSLRSDHANCPYPTSTAKTSAAPCSRSTLVNPPVDAPASTQRRAATARPRAMNPASTGASFSPPREAYRCCRLRRVRESWGLTAVAGFIAGRPATRTAPLATRSAASDRDRASPRRTSSRSSRRRLVIAVLPPCVVDTSQGLVQRGVHPLIVIGMFGDRKAVQLTELG